MQMKSYQNVYYSMAFERQLIQFRRLTTWMLEDKELELDTVSFVVGVTSRNKRSVVWLKERLYIVAIDV